MDALIENLRALLANYGYNLAAALAIFAVGWYTAKVFRRVVVRASRKAGLDETLAVFLSRLAYMAVLVFAVVATMQKLGIEIIGDLDVIGIDRPGSHCPRWPPSESNNDNKALEPPPVPPLSMVVC